jgi:hypothetical protein
VKDVVMTVTVDHTEMTDAVEVAPALVIDVEDTIAQEVVADLGLAKNNNNKQITYVKIGK